MSFRNFLAAGLAVLSNAFPAFAQNSFAPLVERVIPSVVNISTELEKTVDSPEVANDLLFSADGRAALGSGFIISEDGYIATNYHVIEKASKISVVTANGAVYEAVLTGSDTKTDIALVKIDTKEKLQPVEFGDSDNIRVGDWILAVGNPFGLGSSVTAGIVSAKSRDIEDGPYDDYIQTDASINQGNSGGPMFDMEGKVVGINTVIFSKTGNSTGVGFALPSNQAAWVIGQLREKGEVKRRWLGLEIKPAKLEDGRQGLSITAVKDSTLAQKNNLQAGDVILSYDGITAASGKDFSLYTSKLPAERDIRLQIWRGGKIFNLDVKTVPLPESDVPDTKQPAEENIEPENKSLPGTYYAGLGLRLDDFQVIDVDIKSEASQKGVKTGDVLQKVNHAPIFVMEELSRQIEEAALSGEPLRLDFASPDGEEYFVELFVAKKQE